MKGLRAGPTNRVDKLTRGQHTGSNKTGTTNEKESEIVRVGDKNVTPKKLLTNQLLEIQGNFFSQDADRLKD